MLAGHTLFELCGDLNLIRSTCVIQQTIPREMLLISEGKNCICLFKGSLSNIIETSYGNVLRS